MRLKASYTVEGAVITSICIIFFGVAVCLAYDIFKEMLTCVSYSQESFDAVKTYRLKEGLVGVYHAIVD